MKQSTQELIKQTMRALTATEEPPEGWFTCMQAAVEMKISKRYAQEMLQKAHALGKIERKRFKFAYYYSPIKKK